MLFGHNAANEYLGLIERAENGAPRACANWTAPSSGQWAPRRPGGGSFRVLTGRPHPLILTDRLACYDLGMRQPAHGCDVRAKRLTHWLLTNSRRLQPCCSLCQQDWLAITAADLQQTRPVCSRDESKSRRYSPRVSRSMPEPPSKKIYTTEGWIRRVSRALFTPLFSQNRQP